jgi:Skp family chaperone for outer membrane proteins
MACEQTRVMYAALQRKADQLEIKLEDKEEIIRDRDQEIAHLRRAMEMAFRLIEALVQKDDDLANDQEIQRSYAAIQRAAEDALRDDPSPVLIRIADC